MIEVRTIKVKVRFIAEKDEHGYHVFCPELKGLHVEGATLDEAFATAKLAGQAYISSILKHNDPLPVGSQDTRVSIWEIIKKRIVSMCWKPVARVQEISINAA